MTNSFETPIAEKISDQEIDTIVGIIDQFGSLDTAKVLSQLSGELSAEQSDAILGDLKTAVDKMPEDDERKAQYDNLEQKVLNSIQA